MKALIFYLFIGLGLPSSLWGQENFEVFKVKVGELNPQARFRLLNSLQKRTSGLTSQELVELEKYITHLLQVINLDQINTPSKTASPAPTQQIPSSGSRLPAKSQKAKVQEQIAATKPEDIDLKVKTLNLEIEKLKLQKRILELQQQDGKK